MRLSASLTARHVPILAAAGFAAALLTACAGNSPRNPGAAEDKNTSTTLDDDCAKAESRGAPPPVGCPARTENRRTARPLPTLDDPMNLPTLPGGALPGGGVLGR